MKRGIAVVLALWAGGAARAQDAGVVFEPPASQSLPDSNVATPTLGAVHVPVVAGPKNVEIFGYLKVGYYAEIPNNPSSALLASRNGFRLSTLRLGADVKPLDKLEVVISADGSLPQPNPSDALSGSRIVALADAFVEWSPSRYARFRIGQFKAPFDGESLLPDGALPFLWRSIMTDGVAPPDNYPQLGLTLDRQVGAMVSSERLGGDVGVSYAVAAVNGNGPNQLFNDNGDLAYVGRVTVAYRETVELGVNAYLDNPTTGIVPNLITERRVTYGADLAFNYHGFNAFALFLTRDTTHPTTGLPSEKAVGVMGSLRYWHAATGLEGGVRFAYYNPSNVQTAQEMTELNAMVGYRAKVVPARVLLQYTLRIDDAAVPAPSNSLDAQVQVTF